ncbi:unnamed protein product [Lepidochelys olivacea]
MWDFVVGILLLCSLGFIPRQLGSVVHLPDSREFDVSFHSVKESEQFLEKLGEKAPIEQVWVGLVAIPFFKPVVKTVTIFFHTAVVWEEDVCTRLECYTQVLWAPDRVYDK